MNFMARALAGEFETTHGNRAMCALFWEVTKGIHNADGPSALAAATGLTLEEAILMGSMRDGRQYRDSMLAYIVERRREEARLKALLPECYGCKLGDPALPLEDEDPSDLFHRTPEANGGVLFACEAAGIAGLYAEQRKLRALLQQAESGEVCLGDEAISRPFCPWCGLRQPGSAHAADCPAAIAMNWAREGA